MGTTATLTARFVATVTPAETRREYFDRVVTGLALRVAPTGTKSWVLLYRQGRRLRRWTLGRYPTLSLADARDRSRAGLRTAAAGDDPAQAKRTQRDALTVGELAERYLVEYARPRKRSWKEDRRLLTHAVLPIWRHQAARDIQRADAHALVQAVATRGAPIAANRLRALLHTLFGFAVAHEIVEVNPITHVPRPGIERRRDRVLTADGMRTFWSRLDDEPPAMAAALRLRLVTAQRGGEIHDMRWRDVERATRWWTIPAARSKNGLPHRVPLADLALDLIDGLLGSDPEGYVLAGARGKRQRSQAIARLGLDDFRGHDLRRTAASHMASAGVPRLVIGKILNHADPSVTAVYDRHSYDTEKRAALETWATALLAIVQHPS